MAAMVPSSRVLVVAVVLALAAAGGAAAATSQLWGNRGERWNFNKLPDFSYAGYKFGTSKIPNPPVSRNVRDFKKPGMSDSQMLLAAVSWANSQPASKGFIVLSIPAGRYTLTDRLIIRRSKTILRGAGMDKTVLYVPKSLTDRYGPNPDDSKGFYVNKDGYFHIIGTPSYPKNGGLARVSKNAAKGALTVTVDNPGEIKVGQYYDTWWTDVGGRFNNLMFDNKAVAPAKYEGNTRVKFTVKVVGKNGNQIKLERRLPYAISAGTVVVRFYKPPATVVDSGIEGLTFSFRWSWYNGHHLELGFNAVFLADVRDCWVRNVRTINADNTVLIIGTTSSTIDNVRISSSKTRANNFPNKYNEPADVDGHWGVEFAHSFDLMVSRLVVDTIAPIQHSVGTDTSAKWCVVMDSRFRDGNLDLHRGLSGPTLYTNIDVGKGTHGLSSGGPQRSGPNALAGTTWWNIRSDQAMDPNDSSGPPGSCKDFGPIINLVNVNLKKDKLKSMCPTWLYERSVSGPANLYESQYAFRFRR